MCKSINLDLFLALVVFLTGPSRFWPNPKIGDLLTSDDVIHDDIIICYISLYRSHQYLYKREEKKKQMMMKMNMMMMKNVKLIIKLVLFASLIIRYLLNYNNYCYCCCHYCDCCFRFNYRNRRRAGNHCVASTSRRTRRRENKTLSNIRPPLYHRLLTEVPLRKIRALPTDV